MINFFNYDEHTCLADQGNFLESAFRLQEFAPMRLQQGLHSGELSTLKFTSEAPSPEPAKQAAPASSSAPI